MAVTTYSITYTEVFAVVAHEDPSYADPSTSTVTALITRFCAECNVALRAAGMDPTEIAASSGANDPDLYKLIRLKVIQRCAAEWDHANQGDPDTYEHVRTEWAAFLIGLRERPGSYASQQSDIAGSVSLIQSGDSSTVATLETNSQGRRISRYNEFN